MLDIRLDRRQITKHLNDTQRKVIPKVTVEALNDVAKLARSEGIKDVARRLRLPERIIRKRYDLEGNAKQDRIEYVRANQKNGGATIVVYHRGIPVFQVAKGQTKRGVRASSGRLYVGAFWMRGPNSRGKLLVLKRRPKDQLGPQGGRFMLPKISVRKTLEQAFGLRTVGSVGRERFNRAFTARLEAALARL